MRFHSSRSANPIEAITRAQEDRLRSEFDRIEISNVRIVPLPAGWDGRELAISGEQPNGLGSRQHLRLIIAFKRVPEEVLALLADAARRGISMLASLATTGDREWDVNAARVRSGERAVLEQYAALADHDGPLYRAYRTALDEQAD